MAQIRDGFRIFLLRIANNHLNRDDWNKFAVGHYADEEIESLRRRLVEQSLVYPDWQVGWIPRGLQDAARVLAEYLRDYAEESTVYWTEWSHLADDGALSIKVTWSDSETLSTGRCTIPKGHDDHDFWCWVVADNDRRSGLKRHADVERLRREYSNQL